MTRAPAPHQRAIAVSGGQRDNEPPKMITGFRLALVLWPVTFLPLVTAGATAQNAPVQADTSVCDGIKVISNELTSREAMEYCRYAVSERKKVEKYWGPTWTEPITI